jgi:rare lipoprotein A
VRVNDRCGCTHGRIIDVTEGAARKLGMIRSGIAKVRLEILQ